MCSTCCVLVYVSAARLIVTDKTTYNRNWCSALTACLQLCEPGRHWHAPTQTHTPHTINRHMGCLVCCLHFFVRLVLE